MNLLGPLLVVILGVAVFLLGTKAFRKEGLPVTASTRWRGPWARLVGAGCIVLGLVWIVVGLWLGAGAPTQ